MKKKQNFRQGVSYSIQVLAQVMAPPRVGWERGATEAFRAGAAEALGTVVTKHGKDPTIFGLAMQCMSAMAGLPRIGAQLVGSGGLAAVVPAISTFWEEARAGDQPPEEVAASMAAAHALFARAARQDAEGFAASGAPVLAIRIAHNACGLGEHKGERVLPGVLKQWSVLVDTLSRSRAVQSTMVADETASESIGSLSRLMELATTALDEAEVGGTDSSGSVAGARRSSRKGSLRAGLLRRSSSFGGSSNGGARSPALSGSGFGSGVGTGLGSDTLRLGALHVGAAIRTLERVSRSEDGVASLKTLETDGKDSIVAVSGALRELSSARSVETVAVRLLSRLVGGDMQAILSRAEAEAEAGTPAAQDQELACTVLASLCRDAEAIDALGHGDPTAETTEGGDWLLRCVSLVATVCSTTARAAVVEVMRRVAAHSRAYCKRLVEYNALALVAWALFSDEEDEDVVGECGGCIAALTGPVPASMVYSDPSPAARLVWATPVEALQREWLDSSARATAAHATASEGSFSEQEGVGYMRGRWVGGTALRHGTDDEGNIADLDEADALLGDLLLNCLRTHASSEAAAAGCLLAITTLQRHGVVVPAAYGVCLAEAAAMVMVECRANHFVVNLALRAILECLSGLSAADVIAEGSSDPGLGNVTATAAESAGAVRMAIALLDEHSDSEAAASDSAAAAIGLAGSAGGGGGGALAPADAAAGEELTANCMSLLAAILPATPAILSAAKGQGCIRAVLAGASRHRESERVSAAFQAVVTALDIKDEEVEEAVRAVSDGVSLVRVCAITAGPAAGGVAADTFALAEDSAASLGPGSAGADAVATLREAKSKSKRDAASSACEPMLEPLALLEAVTLAPRFAAVAFRAGAVPVLALALGVVAGVSVVKSSGAGAAGGVRRAKAAFAAAGGGAGSAAELESKPGSILDSSQDSLLSRAAGALTNMCRACAELEGGVTGLTGASEAELEEARAGLGGTSGAALMGSTLHSAELCAVVSKALAARPSHRLFASRALPLMQWLTWASTASAARDRAVMVVAAGAVEAVAGVMRAQPANMSLMGNVADALARISDSAKGAVAVATRGATRQLSRLIDSLGNAPSQAADNVLLRFLQVLGLCAAGDETLEILRKQGVAAGLVSCSAAILRKQRGELGDGSAEGSAAGGGSGGAGAASSGSGRQAGKGSSSSASSSSRGSPGGSGIAADANYALDPETGATIQSHLAALLGRLLTEVDVIGAVRRLEVHATGAEDVVGRASAALAAGKRSGRSLKAWEGFDDGAGVEADASQLALVAGVSAGKGAGAEVLASGLAACTSLLKSAAAFAAAIGGVDEEVTASQAQLALTGAVPSAARAVGELVRALRVLVPRGARPDWAAGTATGAALTGAEGEYLFDRDDGAGDGGDSPDGDTEAALVADGEGEGPGAEALGAAEAAEAVSVLLDAMETIPSCSGPAVSALAVLCERRGTAGGLVSAAGGAGASVLVERCRAALERGDQVTLLGGLRALRGAARTPGAAAVCASAGAASLAMQTLGDLADDATPATVAASLSLAAAVCRFAPETAVELLSAGALAATRAAVQRHCTDPYSPRAAVLAAAAGLTRLLVRAMGAEAAEETGRAEEARATAKRIARLGSSSTGYCNSSSCAVTILRLVAAACSAGAGGSASAAGHSADGYTEEAAEAAKAALLEAEAERFVELALVSSSATVEVVNAGRRALGALGVGAARLESALAQVQTSTEAVRSTTAAFAGEGDEAYGLGSASRAVVELRDALRGLSTAVVGAAEAGTLEGVTNWEAFWTVDQAMQLAALASDAVSADARAASASGIHAVHGGEGDEASAGDALVSCLAVGVQMLGRLAQLVTAQFKAKLEAYYAGESETWELDEGADVPPSEVIRAATWVLSSGAVAPSVVEAACGCVRAMVDSPRKADSVQACTSSCTVSSLERLARLLGRLCRRLRFGAGAALGGSTATADKGEDEAGEAGAAASSAAGAGAAASRSSSPSPSSSGSGVVMTRALSFADTKRALRAARGCLQLLAEATRGVLGELSNDAERAAAAANVELVRAGMNAAAAAAHWYAEADEIEPAGVCRSLVGSIVEQLMDAEGGYETAWQLVQCASDAIQPAKLKASPASRQGLNGGSLSRAARAPRLAGASSAADGDDADGAAAAAEATEQSTPEGVRVRLAVAREAVDRLARRYVGGKDCQGRRSGVDDAATPGTVSRLAALFAGLNKAVDAVYGTGRMWRRRALQEGKAAEWLLDGQGPGVKSGGEGGAGSPEKSRRGGAAKASHARAALRRVLGVIRAVIRIGGVEAARAMVDAQIKAGAAQSESRIVISESERIAHNSVELAARGEAAGLRDAVLRLLAQVDTSDLEYEASDDVAVFEGTRSELIAAPVLLRTTTGTVASAAMSVTDAEAVAQATSVVEDLTDVLIAQQSQHDPMQRVRLRVSGVEEQIGESMEIDTHHASAVSPLVVPPSESGGGSDAETVVLGAIDTLARLVGVCPDLGAETGTVADPSVIALRVAAAARAGSFRAVATTLQAFKNSPGIASAALTVLHRASEAASLTPKELGLDRGSLQSVQAAVRTHAETVPAVRVMGASLITSLCEEFEEVSAAMLASRVAEFLAAAEAASGQQRFCDREAEAERDWGWLCGGERPWGPAYYKAGHGDPGWDCPAELAEMLRSGTALDRCVRRIDDSAVSSIEAEAVQGLCAVAEAHTHDPGIAAICMGAIGKLTSQQGNVRTIAEAGAPELCARLCQLHPYCPRLLEALAELCLPMSFMEDLTRQITAGGSTDPLVAGLRRYTSRLSTAWGSPLQWPEPGTEEQNCDPPPFSGPQADAKNETQPRLVRQVLQVLANLACENCTCVAAPPADADLAVTLEADAVGDGRGGHSGDSDDAPPAPPELAGEAREVSMVARFVELGGVAAMARALETHAKSPRVLEDGLCLLSNVAYTGDDLQVIIGKRCLASVSSMLAQYHNDPYLFRMGLRAVGNLSRLDENILRAVGHGVAGGIVSGLAANADILDVVNLGADVIGNLASVDEEAVGTEAGMAILDSAVALSGMAPPVETATLKGALCELLIRDKAPVAILAAMDRFSTKTRLLTSCLRALHYLSATPDQVEHVVCELESLPRVVLAMRSCDYDGELIRRGARVLGAAMEVEGVRAAVLKSGAPQVLMNAADTHASDNRIFFTCLSVVMLGHGEEMFQAAAELNSVQTMVRVARESMDEHDDVIIVLSLLNSWAQGSTVLADQIATHGTSLCLALAKHYETNVGMVMAVLQFLTTVAAQKDTSGPIALLSGGVVSLCMSLVDEHVHRLNKSADPAEVAQPAEWRGAVMQMLAMLLPLVSANPAAAGAFLEDGGAIILAKVDAAYRALNVDGKEYFDRETVEMCHSVVRALLENDPEEMVAEAFDEHKEHGAVMPDEDELGQPAPAAAAAAAASSSSSPGPKRGIAALRKAAKAVSAAASARQGTTIDAEGADLATLAAMRYPEAPPICYKILAAMDDILMKPEGLKRAPGLAVTVWDTAPHRRMLHSDPKGTDSPMVLKTVLPAGKSAAKSTWDVPLAEVAEVRLGLPPGFKARMFGRKAKVETSLVVMDSKGSVMLHIEAASASTRDLMAVAVYAVCRAGGGCVEQPAPPA